MAGQGLVPEATWWCLRFAFEELGLHRVEIAIVPRNRASRRVVEKLSLREEGVAVGYLEIDGHWEDHVRYAMTARGVDHPGRRPVRSGSAALLRSRRPLRSEHHRGRVPEELLDVLLVGVRRRVVPTLRRSRTARMKLSTAPAVV